MKQEFEMSREEMNDILEINKNNMPVLRIGNVTTGMDLQERINAYWKGLSDKYGFKQMTVEGSSRGELFFLAEPKPIVKPKTTTEIKIDEYLGEARNYLNHHVKDALKKIVEQFELVGYKDNIGHEIKNNIAFLALKELGGK